MATLSVAARNAAAAGVAAVGNWISMHTASPGINGANEVPGSTRAQTTWAAPANGVVTGSAAGVAVPAGGPYTHFGIWSALSGGTFVGGDAVDNPESFGSPGTYNVTPSISGDAA